MHDAAKWALCELLTEAHTWLCATRVRHLGEADRSQRSTSLQMADDGLRELAAFGPPAQVACSVLALRNDIQDRPVDVVCTTKTSPAHRNYGHQPTQQHGVIAAVVEDTSSGFSQSVRTDVVQSCAG